MSRAGGVDVAVIHNVLLLRHASSFASTSPSPPWGMWESFLVIAIIPFKSICIFGWEHMFKVMLKIVWMFFWGERFWNGIINIEIILILLKLKGNYLGGQYIYIFFFSAEEYSQWFHGSWTSAWGLGEHKSHEPSCRPYSSCVKMGQTHWSN